MVKYCCVPLCGRFFLGGGGLKFPSDEGLRLKKEGCNKADAQENKKLWNPGIEDIVCRAHFSEHDVSKAIFKY